MSPQDKCALSFYEELEQYDESKPVHLVRHIENRRIYIKKYRSLYDISVYRQLQEADFTFVPKLVEVIEDGNVLILIEEYISGQLLSKALQNGPMEPERAAGIAYRLAQAIEAMQQLDPPIVHRDLKPDNIILTDDDRVMLIDFNTAKHITDRPTDTIALGTPGYAAPEQYGFGASQEKTDIYAFGVLLNEMLTGHGIVEGIAEGAYRKLITECVNLVAEERPSAHAVCTRLQTIAASSNAKEEPAERTDEETVGEIIKAWFMPAPMKHPNWFPGFRRGKILHALISVLVTAFFVSSILCSKYDASMNSTQCYIARVYWLLMYFATFFWFTNYRNIHRWAIFAKKKSKPLRILGIFLTYLLTFVISFCSIILLTEAYG